MDCNTDTFTHNDSNRCTNLLTDTEPYGDLFADSQRHADNDPFTNPQCNQHCQSNVHAIPDPDLDTMWHSSVQLGGSFNMGSLRCPGG